MQGDAKAMRVPFHAADRVLPQAFSHVAKVRHAQVDAGYRVIGKGAWPNCQHLQIVHLDSTVISLQTRVFCRCYALRKVLAPGCKQFGAQVFEECCSLMQIGIGNDATNQLAPQAELMVRAFEKHGNHGLRLCCKHLRSLRLPHKLRIIEQVHLFNFFFARVRALCVPKSTSHLKVIC